MKEKYSFEDLKSIIKKLRSEDGCPWDKVQTHESLRPCLIEESYEVLSAIRILEETGYSENLREELGDILLQVMLHSQIAEEAGNFQVEDVIDQISQKMIRRHPHVFGENDATTVNQVLKNWEDIKKQEKENQPWIKESKVAELTEVEEVPKEFPALIRAQKVLKKGGKVSQNSHDFSQSYEQILEKLGTLKEKYEDTASFDFSQNMGEILLEISNISNLIKVHSEQALTDQIQNYIRQLEVEFQKAK